MIRLGCVNSVANCTDINLTVASLRCRFSGFCGAYFWNVSVCICGLTRCRFAGWHRHCREHTGSAAVGKETSASIFRAEETASSSRLKELLPPYLGLKKLLPPSSGLKERPGELQWHLYPRKSFSLKAGNSMFPRKVCRCTNLHFVQTQQFVT